MGEEYAVIWKALKGAAVTYTYFSNPNVLFQEDLMADDLYGETRTKRISYVMVQLRSNDICVAHTKANKVFVF